ncbi:AAA+-type ATPase, SpoVK/Ycf46/Vps4 family [Pelagirhabdus alkalitolerans]|uniref:AAA+-type ATPase, SpoVK/Ycf46/Vps4 family n=1 Tax=Pelagirhabdus alkalitolerans TaxID=1612202 RepID=A0A1G6H689_9BACI|nr:AAA family ATPase [Pelagirhabdus alkalitolerans]SDB89779.1 AAA+-type ATPase, SpoVK/Ycf46/Vps4 family [Pelagirhabdus alkalitolerans]
MTNYTILSKVNNDSIIEWDQLIKEPPYNEIDVLRTLDQIREESHDLSHQAIGNLHVLLVYHRLMRHKQSDNLSEKLLDKAAQYDEQLPTLTEIQSVMHYHRIKNELMNLTVSEWSIRETDFDQAKKKKMSEWLEQINRFNDFVESYEANDSSSKSELGFLYRDLTHKLSELKTLLEDSYELLQNKRTGMPTKSINQTIKQVSVLLDQFIDAFPKGFGHEIRQSPLQKLEEMVGLNQVKTYMNQYYHYLKYQQDRKSIGFQMVDEPGLHMIITGNPGTGKTTIARLLAEIYHELGLLESKEVIEVNRSHLVGSYVGQSEENTMNYIREAVGGVLFIDEAYSLKREDASGGDYGQAVIDTLVSAMTSGEYANKFAVILAGYPEEMRHFLWSNPGLRSRFPEQNSISLPDFKMEELLEIAEATALDNDYFFTETALNHFYGLIERAKVDDTFGNARTVRDLVMKAIFKKGSMISVESDDHWLDHMRIESKDLAVMSDDKEDVPPMEQLEQLIGLNNIKQEVKKLSSFVQIQQSRKDQGHPMVPIQLHAVFSGNPGTGKTTVAKIYSKMLKECGLLKRGHFVLASRSDLVAGYVGQTAIKTKNKIREALGGVLFIDEAYSLYRGENDFGKEAIDTLVDEMTKHNDNLVVILAGYKQDMKRFIDSNPGLSSRFKKYFEFQDYAQDELLDMTHYHVQNYNYQLTDDAVHYLYSQYSGGSVNGNGRFVVNLVEEAIQYQALRVIESNEEKEMTKLSAEDVKKAWETVKGDNS